MIKLDKQEWVIGLVNKRREELPREGGKNFTRLLKMN